MVSETISENENGFPNQNTVLYFVYHYNCLTLDWAELTWDFANVYTSPRNNFKTGKLSVPLFNVQAL